MADQQPFQLFFKILDAQGEAANLGHAVHVLLNAIEESLALRKEREIIDLARRFADSHAYLDGIALLQKLEHKPFPASEVVAGLHVIMAWRGSHESELFVARTLMQWQGWSRDLTDAERDERLLQALGWLAVAGGNSVPGGWNYRARQRDAIPLHGYALAQRIRKMPGLDRLLDDTASPDDYRPVEPGYVAPMNAQGLPEYLCGHIAEHLYRCGADGPALTLAVIARRVMERFPNAAFRCRQIIDEQDTRAVWALIAELEGQDILDSREEVESLLFALAQTGDRIALCRAAAYAVRRAYHSGDTEMIGNAIGMLAVASGAREPTDADWGCNPVQGAISNAGGYLVRLLGENLRPPVGNSSVVANDDVGDDEPEKPDPDPAIAAANAASDDQPTDEELQDLADMANEVTGAGITVEQLKTELDLPDGGKLAYLKRKQAEALRIVTARKATLLDRAERIKVIESIGNKDVGSTEAKAAVRALEALLHPLQMRAMPDDLAAWRSALLMEFPHAEAAINAVHSDLESRRLNGKKGFLFKPMLLVGKPGTGKSRLARRIAEVSGMPFRMFPCASVADGHIAGVSRGWSSGHPSLPLDAMRQHRISNPVLVLDEIEKSAESRRNGHVVDAVLGMIEPENSKRWLDPFIQGHIDLSAVSWLFTANTLAGLPSPFLDRVRIVHIDGPQVKHLGDLTVSIITDLAAQAGHQAWLPPLDGEELQAITKPWRRHPSIRHLQRLVAAVLRARELAAVRH